MKLTNILLRLPQWSLSTLAVLTALYLTLVPRPMGDLDIPLFPGADKVVHVLMMAGIYVALSLDYMRRGRQRLTRLSSSVLIVLAIAITAFGGLIELLQGAMALGRGCDMADFIADGIGAIAAALFMAIIQKKLCSGTAG